jgi:hypothetical protein
MYIRWLVLNHGHLVSVESSTTTPDALRLATSVLGTWCVGCWRGGGLAAGVIGWPLRRVTHGTSDRCGRAVASLQALQADLSFLPLVLSGGPGTRQNRHHPNSISPPGALLFVI